MENEESKFENETINWLEVQNLRHTYHCSLVMTDCMQTHLHFQLILRKVVHGDDAVNLQHVDHLDWDQSH